MSHVAKRPRLHGPANPALSLSSTSSLLESTRQATSSTPKLRNLQQEHENSLRQSALRLKSNWEDICKRYGRDFDGEGDEIDLETGEVIVDNGHLRHLVQAEDDTWAANGYDDDAASSTSSLDILGMRPMMGRDQMRVSMRRDDEAEESDIDEVEVDKDAIDDLFDELEELTMTRSARLKIEDKKRREKLQELEAPPNTTQRETVVQDKLLSPASSDIVEPTAEESHVQSVMRELEMDKIEIPSLDELPSESLMMQQFGKWAPALLAHLRTLKENNTPPISQDSNILTQLTPVSECETSLADKLVDEAERSEAIQHALVSPPEPTASIVVAEELEPEFEEETELPLELEPLVEPIFVPQQEQDPKPLQLQEESLSTFTVTGKDGLVGNNEEIAIGHENVCLEDGASEKNNGVDIAEDNCLAELPKTFQGNACDETQKATSETAPEKEESERPESSHHNKLEEDTNLVTEPGYIPREVPLEEPATDLNYFYGDIDDLSTIVQKRACVPVTPKNRPPPPKKSKSSRSAKQALSSKRDHRAFSTSKKATSKRRFSDIETPEQLPPSSPTRQTKSQTLPRSQKAAQKAQLTASSNTTRTKTRASAQPRSFWSALPDDPFYDPLWQDIHPDGEPSFEEFEKRRVLLEQHSTKKRQQKVTTDDDLMLVSPSSKVERTPKSKVQATPKTKDSKAQSSRKEALNNGLFENKLHTPRSGKFLEILQKKLLGEKDATKKEESETDVLLAAEDNITDVKDQGSIENAVPRTPTTIIKNEYGLSDDEDELAREVWFVKDKEVEITGTRKPRRKRGRPPKETPKEKPKAGVIPLVVNDQPQSSPIKTSTDGIKHEEAEVSDNPFASCGDPGFRCEKVICFRCIEDWDT